MDSAENLRKELAKVYNQLKGGKIDLHQAKLMIATANTIVKSVEVELDHAKLIGDTSPNSFMIKSKVLEIKEKKPKELKE